MNLPAVIHDNMVLQQNAEVPIWGTGEPGERMTVVMRDQRVMTTADGEGRWRVGLKPLKAGGPFEMTLSGNQTVTLHNVLVGEVWVCSGQSNIAWPVRRSLNAEQEIARADHPMIRLFTVQQTVADQPLQDTGGRWGVCSPETVGDFSGTGYFFGRDLHRALDVPVGLISSSLGGTRAEVWTSLPALQSDPDFRPFLDQWAQAMAECPDMAKIDRRAYRQPAGLYQGMVAPLIPYAIQGVVWQQGLSNADQAYIYRKLFQGLIQEWRRAWGQGDFPFLFVQMPSYPHAQEDSTVAELKESQATALSLPKTGMVVSMDIGEPTGDGLHFKDKQEVGRRLCLTAQAVAYGRDIVCSGPLYESMTVEGNRVRLRFKHGDGGLVARGGLKGFMVAGPDRKFIWGAETRIEGETLLVWSDSVQNPVAVRYAWGANPVCNLYNRAGLPASTFRTDDWPGVTYDKR